MVLDSGREAPEFAIEVKVFGGSYRLNEPTGKT
jgi:hypothetical protein